MLYKSNFSVGVAVTNQGEAMEADTISKNGRSSKSHTSRGNRKLLTLFILIASAFVLSSCSSPSPESDGIKAAKKMCDCGKDIYVIAKKDYESYIKNFNSYAFKTRIEAREKLNELHQKLQESLNECERDGYAYLNELKSKYITNEEKVGKFQFAFDAHLNVCRPPRPDYSEYGSKIESLIQAIIPPKPNLERIKNEVIERTREIIQHDHYLLFDSPFLSGFGPRLNIRESEIKEREIQILNEHEQENNHIIEARIIFQTENNGAYEAIVNMIYDLLYDDWNLKSLKTIEFKLVKTGEYGNCIAITKNVQQLYPVSKYYLEVTNNCSENLIIMGKALLDEWTPFSIKIGGNNKREISYSITEYGYTRYKNINDYQILCVERE